MNDIFNLERFIEAQEQVYAEVVNELKSGIKRGHWIWHIFPQIAGLGFSPMSDRYSIKSIEEANAYLDHPILGPRLIVCVELVIAIEGRSVEQILGHPDYMKFRSCLTLFLATGMNHDVFERALDKYYGGVPDRLTIDTLNKLQTGL